MNPLHPAYARQGREIGTLHFGLGAFHRGHQAVYLDQALRQGAGEWGIFGISPRSTQVSDALRSQNFCYTVNARQGRHQDPVVIGSIFDGGLYDLENNSLRSAILSSSLKLITITVTEKSYRVGTEPESMPNRLIDILKIRFENELAAPIIISCDNLPANGDYLRKVLEECSELRALNPDFRSWLRHIEIPNSMVDRIVPAITPLSIEEFERDFGYRDQSLISTEPFRQWVVAPHKGCNQLDDLGIEISSEVDNFEKLKLRLFNGVHSTTAYFSQLSGLEYVYQAIALPEWEAFISRLQIQLIGTFTAPTSIDVSEYCRSARLRIGNSAVAHRSAQIAMDGSAKLPQRLFQAMNFLQQSNSPRDLIAFAISLWIKFLQSGLPVMDPLGDELMKRARCGDSHLAVSQVMQTPGLDSPISEVDWPLIAQFLDDLGRFTPIDIAAKL